MRERERESFHKIGIQRNWEKMSHLKLDLRRLALQNIWRIAILGTEIIVAEQPSNRIVLT